MDRPITLLLIIPQQVFPCHADELAESTHSKREAKYAKDFSESIDKMQIGFGDKLRRAIVEHQSIMDCFLIDEYGEKYKDQLDEICARMNRLRNDLAHGNIDLKFCPEHLDSVYLRSSQNSQPNSDTSDVNSGKER